jgi:hypothetical protein
MVSHPTCIEVAERLDDLRDEIVSLAEGKFACPARSVSTSRASKPTTMVGTASAMYRTY